MTNRVTAEEMYAIKYLDSGGDPDTFSHRHKKLHTAVINEAKRRLMVEIRYKIAKSKKGKGLIYKNIKKPTTVTLEPIELYQALGKLSYSKLKNLNKTLLQSRKQ